ncbi:MAG: glycosyltransferase family 2 protein [Lachnospiraceae bacterium]|nr:glycosyltransferase family 2 protein [Lachnospiraceae bacterium]
MTNEKLYLSICIPTYDRCELLIRCIESIVIQPEFFREKAVEIVISDNCGNIRNKEIADNYNRIYGNIRYFRNKENVFGKNFPLALDRGNGVYCKLVNDTVVFKQGSLSKIIGFIKKYEDTKPAFVFCERAEDTEEKYTDLEGLLYRVGNLFTWIGSGGIWKCDNEGLEKSCRMDDSLWPARYLLNYCYNKENTVVINNSDLFLVMGGKTTHYNAERFLKIFHDDYLEVIQEYVEIGAVSHICYDSLEKDLLFSFYTSWLVFFEFNNENGITIDNLSLVRRLIKKTYGKQWYFEDWKRIYYKEWIAAKNQHTRAALSQMLHWGDFKRFIKKVFE